LGPVEAKAAVEILRRAVATIWTIVEYGDERDVDRETLNHMIQTVTADALDLTMGFAKPKNLAEDHDWGIDGWRQWLEERGLDPKESLREFKARRSVAT